MAHSSTKPLGDPSFMAQEIITSCPQGSFLKTEEDATIQQKVKVSALAYHCLRTFFQSVLLLDSVFSTLSASVFCFRLKETPDNEDKFNVTRKKCKGFPGKLEIRLKLPSFNSVREL